MPRIRSLKIGFFHNEQLCELSFGHRLLFEGLWLLADKEGRLEDRPKRIKAELFPYDEIDVDRFLGDLARCGFLIRYEAGNLKAVQILNFLKHQRPNNKEAASVIQPPNGQHEKEQGEWDLGSGIRDLGNGNGGSSTARVEPASTGVLEFPTIGTKGKHWALTDAQVAEWQTLFPSLDILAEARKALAWVQANPGRQKTAGGMLRFLVNWLNRSVDRRGSVADVTQHVSARDEARMLSRLTPFEQARRAGLKR